MDVELSEYFGALVVVQLRDAVAQVKAGDLTQSLVLDPSGQPILDPQKMTPIGRRQIEPVVEPEGYSLTFTGRLIPAQGGRVHIAYEHDGHLVRMTVRPSDIVAVSWIEGKAESRIERPAS